MLDSMELVKVFKDAISLFNLFGPSEYSLFLYGQASFKCKALWQYSFQVQKRCPSTCSFGFHLLGCFR